MTTTPTEDATAAANVAVVRRVLTEVWTEGHVERADELVADGAVDHDKQPGEADGLASFKEHVGILRAMSSDMHLEIDQLWGVGDRVVARWRWQGVHDGPMFDLPPTGRRFDFTTIAIYQVEDGKITSIWKATDLLQMMEQLAVLPPRGTGPVGTLAHLVRTYARLGVSKVRYERARKRAAAVGG